MSTKHRTSTQEMKAWVSRVEKLRASEDRCPNCIKVKNMSGSKPTRDIPPGGLICSDHIRIRHEMVFGSNGNGMFKTMSGWKGGKHDYTF